MKRLRYILVCVCLVASAMTFEMSGATPQWEEVTSPTATVTQMLEPTDSNLEVAVVDGYIYVRCEKPVNIKLFSILGQLLKQETVKPGLHRIKLASRGIFILRTDNTTRRITL